VSNRGSEERQQSPHNL